MSEIALIVATFFIAMYMTKTWFYIDAYQDEYFLIEQACLNSPDSWFAWHIRAIKRWETQSYKEAMILWTMAKIISPKEFKLLYNLSTVLMIAGQKNEALKYLELAEQNIPEGQEEQTKKIIEEFKKGNVSIII